MRAECGVEPDTLQTGTGRLQIRLRLTEGPSPPQPSPPLLNLPEPPVNKPSDALPCRAPIHRDQVPTPVLHHISAWDWATSCERGLCKEKRNEEPKPLQMPDFFRSREVSGGCTQIDAGGCMVGALDPVTSGEDMSYVFTVVDKFPGKPIALGFCNSPFVAEAARANVPKKKKGSSEAQEVCALVRELPDATYTKPHEPKQQQLPVIAVGGGSWFLVTGPRPLDGSECVGRARHTLFGPTVPNVGVGRVVRGEYWQGSACVLGGGGGPNTHTQSQHANYWAPRTRKRHQQEHRPQRPTESSDPTQHAKGRTVDRPGPRKGATTRRNVTQGGGDCAPLTQWGSNRSVVSVHDRRFLSSCGGLFWALGLGLMMGGGALVWPLAIRLHGRLLGGRGTGSR